jgi:hypothetical protein
VDREFPTGKTLSEPIEIVQLAPAGFHEEIADKQPHEQLRNPFLPVKQTKKFFYALSDLH